MSDRVDEIIAELVYNRLQGDDYSKRLLGQLEKFTVERFRMVYNCRKLVGKSINPEFFEYLLQEKTGRVYIRTERLLARKDMIPIPKEIMSILKYGEK